MKRIIFILAFFVVQSAVSYCSAQSDEVTFDLITDNSKLLGKITAITQDRYGYMWFAGQGARCLYRFDGYRFTSFKHDSSNTNSPGGTNLETVYADPSGVIWIGYYTNGLDEFNPATHQFRHFRYNASDPQSLSNDSVSQVLKDKEGRIWVGTQHGLNLLNEKDGTFKRYYKIQGDTTSLSSNVIRAIYQDHEGTIWVGTGYPFDQYKPEDGGLNRLEHNGTFTQFLHDANNSHSLLNNKIRALFEDSHGNFWIGTGKNGLHIMNRKNGSFERFVYDPANPGKLSGPEYNPNLPFDHITFIAEDGSGVIWMGTYASGITRYDPKNKKVTRFMSNNGFPDRTGWSAFTSNDGVLWISTQEPNLFRINPFAASVAKTSANPVQCFYEDENKMLWAGTMERGLFQFDQEKKLLHAYGAGFIHSIFQQGKDTFLLGTGNDVTVFNRKTKNFEPFGIHDETYSILKDKDGFTWFATAHSGLLRFNPKDKFLVNYLSSSYDSGANRSPEIVSLLQDRSGFIWAGTVFKGIYRLDMSSGKIEHYLNGLVVACLYQSSDESILAGTSNGLYRYNKTTNDFSPLFDLQSDVSRNAVVSIMEDDFKNLWIVTRLNIVRFDPQTKQTSIYGKQYDISPNTLTYGIYKNTKGEILVGNNRGFYTFQPDQLSVSRARSKIIVTDFYVNNTENREKGILQKPVEETDTIELKHDQNHLTFNFALIDYRSPDENKIFTRLVGFDTIWRKASGEKSVDYFNVPPGYYRFQLKAFNSDGMMSEKSVSVIISPPWWKTWWAYTFYVICLIAASIVANRIIRHRIIEKERAKNREKEIAHARAIEKAYNELKSTQAQLIQSEKMASLGELTAGIAHEIQNPLNFVNNFSDVNAELIDEVEQEMAKGNIDQAKSILNDIKDNEQKINHHGKRADSIVRGMLQHSRTSSGQKELTDINKLADEYLRLSYHGLRAKDKSFNAEIKTDFDDSIGKINIVPQDIGRVLLNLINNAFYAVNEKAASFKLQGASLPIGQAGFEPMVSVTTQRAADKVLISVSDNGGGIADSIREKIFQPFFTTKPTGQGTGLGLSLAYDIIKAHGGEIKINTKEGEGSEFVIQLPNKSNIS